MEVKQEKGQKKSSRGVGWHQTDEAGSRRPGNSPEMEGPSLQAGRWVLTVDGHALLLRMLHVLHQLLCQLLQLLHLFQCQRPWGPTGAHLKSQHFLQTLSLSLSRVTALQEPTPAGFSDFSPKRTNPTPHPVSCFPDTQVGGTPKSSSTSLPDPPKHHTNQGTRMTLPPALPAHTDRPERLSGRRPHTQQLGSRKRQAPRPRVSPTEHAGPRPPWRARRAVAGAAPRTHTYPSRRLPGSPCQREGTTQRESG